MCTGLCGWRAVERQRWIAPVLAAVALATGGCARPAPQVGDAVVGHATRIADRGAALSAAPSAHSSAPDRAFADAWGLEPLKRESLRSLRGRVAYTRDGRARVLDLATHHDSGVGTPSPAVAPVFTAADHLLVLGPGETRGGGALRVYTSQVPGGPGKLVPRVPPVYALGYDALRKEVLVYVAAGRPEGNAGAMDQRVSLRMGSLGGHLRGCPVGGVVYDSGAERRIRRSPSGSLVTVPVFASSAGSPYEVRDLGTGRFVGPDVYRGQFRASFDLGARAVYRASMWDGLEMLDPATALATGRAWPLDGMTPVGGVAVSEPLGVAVVGGAVVTGERSEPFLFACDLASGAIGRLCPGEDPDIWPR